MLSWALAFFMLATISALFGFTGIVGDGKRLAAIPPAGWTCPDGWVCVAQRPLPAPADFICPQGWDCIQRAARGDGGPELFKILFVVFFVLFLVSLVAGLLRRP